MGVLTVTTMCTSLPLTRAAQTAGSSADGVHIAVARWLAPRPAPETGRGSAGWCVGNHAAHDAVRFLSLLAQSAEEGKVKFILDNRLVAAT